MIEDSGVVPRAIHVLAVDASDWIVKEEGGRELGHYPSKEAAQAVAYKVARKRQVEVLIHGRGGKLEKRLRPSKGWINRLFGRG
jgi:uncharacterized protein DUF2188